MDERATLARAKEVFDEALLGFERASTEYLDAMRRLRMEL